MRRGTCVRGFALAMLVASLVTTGGRAQEATPSATALPTADAICADVHHGHGSSTPAAGAGLVVLPEGEIDFDLLFIDLMIPHHESAVDMAIIAAERGQHVEVRDLAGEIITTQSAEIAQLRAWRDAWYPGAPVLDETATVAALDALMMESPGMGGMAGAAEMLAPHDLMPLCMADTAEFDALFLEGMMPHHQGAVLLATEALNRSQRPEVIALDNAIIAAQGAEIAQMAGWLEAWYPGRSTCNCSAHDGSHVAPTATP
jgi:uncharacterized protein (DUF305 family)